VLTYVNVSASLLPNTGALSFYLVAIANASSIFGRYAAGSVSDKLGGSHVVHFCVTFEKTHVIPFRRTYECYDPVHSCSWSFDVCLAICTDQSVIDRSDRPLWVS
jgi:hypothetical protein